MMPPTCAIGNAMEPTSPSSSPTRPCSVQPYAAASRVASVCRAPLGSPLDPEVKYTQSVEAAGPGSAATSASEADGADSPTTRTFGAGSAVTSASETDASDSPTTMTFGAVGRPDASSTKSVPRQTPGTRMNSARAVATAAPVSLDLYSGMIGAWTAPSRASAAITMTVLIRVGSCQATRVPAPMPWADRATAVRSERSLNSWKESV